LGVASEINNILCWVKENQETQIKISLSKEKKYEGK